MAFDYEATIEECGRLLTGNEDELGAGLVKINSPLLMVYAGQEAIRYEEYTKECFRKCWRNQTDLIQTVSKSPFSASAVKGATVKTIQKSGFHVPNEMLTAVFWDVMDDDFDAIFHGLQDQVTLPANYHNHRFFFLFYKQEQSEVQKISEPRVKQVLSWAQEKGEHVFLFSNVKSAAGILGEDDIDENYALACDIVVMMDSYTNRGQKLNLTFTLEQNLIYSAGFSRIKKSTKDIAKAVTTSILENYLGQPVDQSEYGINVDLDLYRNHFEKIFKKYLQVLLPEDTSFLSYVPYTSAIQDALTPTKKLLGSGNMAGFSSDNAKFILKSMGDFWPAIKDRYYLAPIEAYMEDDHEELEGETGREWIRKEVVKLLYSILSYQQMKNENVVQSLVDSYKEGKEKLVREGIRIHRTGRLSAFLGEAATGEVKTEVFCWFYDMLIEEVQNIALYADDFERLMRSTLKDLKMNPPEDETISQAYKRLSTQIIQADDTFKGSIRPCSDARDLWEMLKTYFRHLIRCDGGEVFRYSLMDELKWRAEEVKQVAVVNIILNCFTQDISTTRRVTTFNSPAANIFTMMTPNVQIDPTITPDMLGTIFNIPNQDEVHRIDIFVVDPEAIIWNYQEEA